MSNTAQQTEDPNARFSESADDGEAVGPEIAEEAGPSGLLALFDPGWLMLISGVVLIAVTVLIPAKRELEQAEFYRSRVEAISRHRAERLKNYSEYIAALDRGEPAVVEALAARQKNLAREGLELILPDEGLPVAGSKRPLTEAMASPLAAAMATSTLPQLEPPTLTLPEPPKVDVNALPMLERWALDEHARWYMLGAGALCILFGLLPWGRMATGGGGGKLSNS